MTFADAVGEIASAAGQQVDFHSIGIDEFVAALREHELPAAYVDLLRYLFSELLDGRNEYVADGVQRALGREPRDFAAYAREASRSGAWGKAVLA